MRKPVHIVWKTLRDGGSVILDLESGRYYSLNETAFAMWLLLESGQSVPETIQRVARAYNVEEGEVSIDLGVLVDSLVGKGLLEEGHPDDDGKTAARANRPLPTSATYLKPELTAHDAVEKVTAGTTSGTGYSSGYSSTYYYYYYY